jgi:hypothetical protein
MTNLENVLAMQCFWRLALQVKLDPDPKTQNKLQEEYNCKNCDSWACCSRLSEKLKR